MGAGYGHRLVWAVSFQRPPEPARWEALVAVKSMFHDEFDGGSLYYELMVMKAPTRVIGGVTVKF